MTPRVVFDCMVFLQGAGRPAGPAWACFRLVDDGQVELFLSAEIVTEIRDVLSRPKTLRKFPSLTPEWIETFLWAVEGKAFTITDAPKVETVDRDPKDEPYLNLAIAAKAKYLVSRDRDLLDLMADATFRQRHPDLHILDPVDFLGELGRLEAPRNDLAQARSPGPEDLSLPHVDANGEGASPQ